VNQFLGRRASLVAVFLIGLALRSYQRDTLPKHNETIDEYAWAWSGMTLLREGTPKAWSYLGYYHDKPWITWRSWGYKIVRPWLDHPPLFSAVMGAWMVAGGYKDIFEVDLGWMRRMPWFLYIANFWLLVRLCRRYFEDDAVLLGMLFLAVSPLVVIDQKLVICENWLVGVYAATHTAMLDWLDKKKRRTLYGVALGAFALPFSKVAAVGYSLYLGTVALLRRDRALAIAVTAGTAAGILAYVAWGWFYSWHDFKEVMYSQSTRFHDLSSGFDLIFAHKMVSTKWLYYPFYLGLFAALFDSVGDERAREFYLQYPIFIGCLIFFVDSGHIYGWYVIPMYPVLCMGLAQYVLKMIRQPDSRYLIGFALIALPYSIGMLEPILVRHPSPFRYGFLALFVGALALSTVWRRPRLYAVTSYAMVAGLVVGDIGWVLTR
jgi:hypothetical protein